MAFCTKCGSKLDEGAAFCKNCGAPTGAAIQAQRNGLKDSTPAVEPVLTQYDSNAKKSVMPDTFDDGNDGVFKSVKIKELLPIP